MQLEITLNTIKLLQTHNHDMKYDYHWTFKNNMHKAEELKLNTIC
jgi:hypothetical protein